MTSQTPSLIERLDQPSHTTGPWSVEGPDAFGDFNIHCQHERAVVAAVINNVRPPDEVAANARLIAAAPALLEALAWALPLAETALNAHRHERIRCGHQDIRGNNKSGEIIGLHQNEIDDAEHARAALSSAKGSAQP